MHAFWKLGGKCAASVWFVQMVHVTFGLQVQKYLGTLSGNIWKSCKSYMQW